MAAQCISYPVEVAALKSSKGIPHSSPLRRLNPIIGEDGVLRVGGRLENAPDLTSQEKHPIILPGNMHAGPQQLQAMAQTKFWLPGARNVCRQIFRQCVRCTRLRAVTATQMMAPLPPARVTPS